MFQMLLLQESWKDLFLLHLSQWAIPWDLGHLLSSRQSQLVLSTDSPFMSDDHLVDMEIKTMQVSALSGISETRNIAPSYINPPFLSYFKEIMCRFRQISPDGTECGCLKAIVLFKPGTYGQINLSKRINSIIGIFLNDLQRRMGWQISIPWKCCKIKRNAF